MPKGLPNENIIRNAQIEGEIIHLPRQYVKKMVIDVKLHYLNYYPVSALVRLSCYHNCPKLGVGDKLSMRATLKKIHDFNNPATRSFKQWAWAHHIDRIGYFLPSSVVVIGNSKRYWVEKIRKYVYVEIQKFKLDIDAKALIAALTIGKSDDISFGLWKLFRETGTAHLMVISGAHVGLITGVCFFLFNHLWRVVPYASLYLPAQRFAAIAACCASLIYALVSGFAIPAQRAVIMSVVVLYRFMGGQYLNIWQAWQIALVLCVMIEPHSLIMPGFYLSFMAVAVILLINQRFKYHGIKKTFMIQIGCQLGLMPLTLYLFNYLASNGLLTNLILIPYVSILILPISILKVILIPVGCGSVGDFFFNKLVILLIKILSFCNQLSFLNSHFSLQSIWQVCEIMIAFGVVILLPKKGWLLPSIILLTTAFIPKKISPITEHAQIRVIDVGQGLSVLVATKNHHLLYDTGVKFYGGGDMGERVILPFLRYFSIKNIDVIVVSHPDLDHRGGLNSISFAYPKALLISDSPSFYHCGYNCHAFPSWEWDGVRFEFLPLKAFYGQKNNHSCVLKISSPSRSFLLTGDIEREAERYLLQHYRKKLLSDFLLIPHHGSRTSSTTEFIEAVSPSVAIISSGLDNRYHFPHAAVLKRLNERSIQVKNTAFDGIIKLVL